MPKREDLAGRKFERWEVLSFDSGSSKKSPKWACRCACGKERSVRSTDLKNGRSKSCGCFHKDSLSKRNTIHSMSGIPAYTSWASMLQRCSNTKYHSFNRYGGRGITICPEWLDFENFYKDMGDRPEGMTLDRKDNNKGYSKGNCRWATKEVQDNNRNNSLLYCYQGETLSISQWSRKLGIVYGTLYNRLAVQKLSFEEAISKPVRRQKKNKRSTK